MKKIFAFLALTSAFIAPSHADVVYTSSASFLSQLQTGSYTQKFNTVIDSGPQTKDYKKAGYSYTAFSEFGLYSDGNFLGAAQSNTPLVITFTGKEVNALGANFYNTNDNDVFKPAKITIALSNGTTTTFAPDSIADSYRGFTTDVFITSLTITNTNANRYVGLDNLTIGLAVQAADVPEPASLAIMGLGVAGIAAMRRRKA